MDTSAISRNLGRRFVIGLSANGVIIINDSEAGPNPEFAANALPVYSTDTREEADALIHHKGHRRVDGVLVWPDFPGVPEALNRVAMTLEAVHKWQKWKKERTP